MNELVLIGFFGLMLALILGAFVFGMHQASETVGKLKRDLVTERAVRHNLNCLVVDLRFAVEQKCLCIRSLRADVQQNKADALAFNSLKGQWVTDNKHLVEYHIRKECFRRIGYPEERL